MNPRTVLLSGLGLTTAAFLAASYKENREVNDMLIGLSRKITFLGSLVDKHQIILDEFEIIALTEINNDLTKFVDR